MEAVDINSPDLWKTLDGIFGPGGIATLIGFGVSVYWNKLLWVRIKEKDLECRKEIADAAQASKERFEQMREDIKQAFETVGKLSEKVTVLVERTTNTRTRAE